MFIQTEVTPNPATRHRDGSHKPFPSASSGTGDPQVPPAQHEHQGADQGSDLFVGAGAAAPLHDGNALGMNREVFKLSAEPQFDVGLLPNGAWQWKWSDRAGYTVAATRTRPLRRLKGR